LPTPRRRLTRTEPAKHGPAYPRGHRAQAVTPAQMFPALTLHRAPAQHPSDSTAAKPGPEPGPPRTTTNGPTQRPPEMTPQPSLKASHVATYLHEQTICPGHQLHFSKLSLDRICDTAFLPISLVETWRDCGDLADRNIWQTQSLCIASLTICDHPSHRLQHSQWKYTTSLPTDLHLEHPSCSFSTRMI
jgi:hypothetical protein